MASRADSASRRPWSSRLHATFTAERGPPRQDNQQQQQQQPRGEIPARGSSPGLRRVGELFRKFIGPPNSPQRRNAAAASSYQSRPEQAPPEQTGSAEPAAAAAPAAEAPRMPDYKRPVRPRSRSHSVEQFLRRLLPSPAAAKSRRSEWTHCPVAAASGADAPVATECQRRLQGQEGKQEAACGGSQRLHCVGLNTGSNGRRDVYPGGAAAADAAEHSPAQLPFPRSPDGASSRFDSSPSFSDSRDSGRAPAAGALPRAASGLPAASRRSCSLIGTTRGQEASPVLGGSSNSSSNSASPEGREPFGFSGSSDERGGGGCRSSNSSRKRSCKRRPSSRPKRNTSPQHSPRSAESSNTSRSSSSRGRPRGQESPGSAMGDTEAADRSCDDSSSTWNARNPSDAEEVLVVERRTTQITTITTTITAQPEAGRSTVFRSSAECTVDELQQHWSFANNSSSNSCSNNRNSSSSSSSAAGAGPDDTREQPFVYVEELNPNEGGLQRQRQQQHQQEQQQQQGQQHSEDGAGSEASPTASTTASCATPLTTLQVDQDEQLKQQQEEQDENQQPGCNAGNPGITPASLGGPHDSDEPLPVPAAQPSGRQQPQHTQQQLLQREVPLQCLPCLGGVCPYRALFPSAHPRLLSVTSQHPQHQQQQQHQCEDPHQPSGFPSSLQQQTMLQQTVNHHQQQDRDKQPLTISEESRQQQRQPQQPEQHQLCGIQEAETQQLLTSTEAFQQQLLQHQQALQHQQHRLLQNQKEHQLRRQPQQQLGAPRVRPFSYNASAVVPGVFAVPPDPLLVTIRPSASRYAAGFAADSSADTFERGTASVAETPCTPTAIAAKHNQWQQEQQQQQQEQQQLVPCVAGRRGASRPPKRVSWARNDTSAPDAAGTLGAASSLALSPRGQQTKREAWLSPATGSTVDTPSCGRDASPCEPLPPLYPPLGADPS